MFAVFPEDIPEYMCLPPPQHVSHLNQQVQSLQSSLPAPILSIAQPQIIPSHPSSSFCIPSFAPVGSSVTPLVYAYKVGDLYDFSKYVLAFFFPSNFGFIDLLSFFLPYFGMPQLSVKTTFNISSILQVLSQTACTKKKKKCGSFLTNASGTSPR